MRLPLEAQNLWNKNSFLSQAKQPSDASTQSTRTVPSIAVLAETWLEALEREWGFRKLGFWILNSVENILYTKVLFIESLVWPASHTCLSLS
jgi:hypothetical protein